MFEARKYQVDAIDSVFKYIKKNPDKSPLVALPTGSGKTAVMRGIVERLLVMNPSAQIILVSHESEILKQNYSAMVGVGDVGMYSAGLDRREVKQITVAGIQSVFRKPELFKKVTHLIIDEAHTIPMDDDSMYRKFINGIGKHIRIGLTATAYRSGQGHIVGADHMFDKIVIDLTFGAKFTRLVKDGYISPITINSTKLKLDAESIKTVAGDFSLKDMSIAFDREALTSRAVDEMVAKGAGRKKWLVFAIDIDHADNICDMLNTRGIKSCVVHSKMEFDKDFVLDQFTNGNTQAIVNVGMLTTGFDMKSIDLIGLLRPTQSASLHVQMIGRGLRICEGKKSCLVLDYAGNTERLGAINKITPYKRAKGEGTGEPITKTCPKCNTITTPMVKVCEECGHVFEFKQLLEVTSGDANVIASNSDWMNVSHAEYERHTKKGSKTSISVRYHCGLRYFKEWICPDHSGYAKAKSIMWLKKRGHDYVDLDGAIEFLRTSVPPKRIKVDTSGKFNRIIDYEW